MLKTIYEEELQQLKDWDQVQCTEEYKGYDFIATAGHGYLVVPKEDNNFKLAKKICNYGFTGRYAAYLEEDCELSEFLTAIGAL